MGREVRSQYGGEGRRDRCPHGDCDLMGEVRCSRGWSAGGSTGNPEPTADPALGIRKSIPEEMTAEVGLCLGEECHGTYKISWGEKGERDSRARNLQGHVGLSQGTGEHNRSWS